MTFRIIPFAPEHVAQLKLQVAQAWFDTLLSNPAYARALDNPGLSFTGLLDDRVIGCAGLLDAQFPGLRGVMPDAAQQLQGWALISGELPARYWPRAVKFAHQVLARAELSGARRIEAMALDGFVNAHRLLLQLGFRAEGKLHRWGPTAQDHWVYARWYDPPAAALEEAA